MKTFSSLSLSIRSGILSSILRLIFTQLVEAQYFEISCPLRLVLTSKLKSYWQAPEADRCIDLFTSAISLNLHFLMALTKLRPEAKALHSVCQRTKTMLHTIQLSSLFINALAGALRVSEQHDLGQ